MAIDWKDVIFRGDAEDVGELYSAYRVGDYLEAFEENRRQQDLGIREQLLKRGIRMNRDLSPRIFEIFRGACRALELDSDAEVFCLPDQSVNAFALVEDRAEGRRSLIGVTAGALEKLEDAELASVLGHELGHFLFGHNRLNALLSTDDSNPSVTVLPRFGEALFLRWRKKAEISADRAGLLASRDVYAASRALLKAEFGLSERNLNLDIDGLIRQLEELKERPEMVEEAFASHPLLPIRLKALELFSKSEKAARNGLPVTGTRIGDEELETGVTELVRLSRRYPRRPVHEAIMKTVALGGARVLSADRDVNDDEIKILIQILHQWFTDDPEEVVVTDRSRIQAELPAAIERVNAEGDENAKKFILSRLTDIALADGALMDEEGGVILEIAAALKVAPKQAYGIMIGGAQAVGFRTDVKLNTMAEKIRNALHLGLFQNSPGGPEA